MTSEKQTKRGEDKQNQFILESCDLFINCHNRKKDGLFTVFFRMKGNIELLQIIGNNLIEHPLRTDSLCYIHKMQFYVAIKKSGDTCAIVEWTRRYVIKWKRKGVDEYIVCAHLQNVSVHKAWYFWKGAAVIGNSDHFWEGNLKSGGWCRDYFSLSIYLYCSNVLPCACISSSN